MNNTLILFLVAYVLYILIWGVINIVAYFLSIALKKPAIHQALNALAAIIAFIFNFLLGIWLLWIGIELFIDGKYLIFFLYFLFGSSIALWVINILQLPFYGISGYFSAKIDEFDSRHNTEIEYEVLSKDGKVINTVSKDLESSSKMARYFIFLYFLNLLPLLLFSIEREGLTWDAYILKPFSGVVFISAITGIPYGIYNKIKSLPFFTKDKRDFFTNIWKTSSFILIGFECALILVALAMGKL